MKRTELGLMAALLSVIGPDGPTPAIMSLPIEVPKPAERNERFRFGAGASKKRRRPRPKIHGGSARGDAKREARAKHRETVKLQQAAGLEWQRRRNEIQRREKKGERIDTSDHATLHRLGDEMRKRRAAYEASA